MKTFQLTTEDVDTNRQKLISLLKQSYEINFPEKELDKEFFEGRLQSLKNYLHEGKAIVIGVKNDKSELLGFVWFFEKAHDKILHINSIVVDKTFRKQGVGKRLWSQIEKYANEKGLTELELIVTKNNKDAVNFYENRDFKPERLIMKKRLLN